MYPDFKNIEDVSLSAFLPDRPFRGGKLLSGKVECDGFDQWDIYHPVKSRRSCRNEEIDFTEIDDV